MTAQTSTAHLAWLLAIMDRAVVLLDEVGCDVDARVLEAHRAQLAAGREWPGMPIDSPQVWEAEQQGFTVVS